MNPEELIARAVQVRENACAGYSHYKVGAALLASSGKVYAGCNVENSTYGLTVCAERVALWKALSEGERKFTQLVVVTSSEPPASPCGACRQLLWEFCGDIEVILANLQGFRQTLRLAEIFPRPFDQHFL
ncbi:MAG TPA: cytidine deaminase [Terriglobia bacterium]|nr:cytidine deaminase [Terriglobia bacterium]